MSEVTNIANMLRRRWLVIMAVCLIGFALLPLLVVGLPVYKATASILIVSEAQKDTTASDPNLPSIITSTEVMSRVINLLKLNTDPVKLANKIKTKLPAKASILELTYKDTDGVRAATIVNAVVDETVKYYHELATRGYGNVIVELNTRIAESQAKIAAADRRLQKASAANAFASSDKALDNISEQIGELQVQRGQAAATLAADQATASMLQKQLADIDPIVRGEILQKDVVYQQLQLELGKDVADLISERSSFRDSFPGLASLAKRVDRERSQLLPAASSAIKNGVGMSPSYTQTVLDGEKAIGAVSADTERLRATDAQLADQQRHLKQIAGALASVGTLRAERDAALQQYTALTARLAQAQGDAAMAASLGNLVVVGRAVPGPSSLVIYVAALVLAIIATAMAVAYAIDGLDRRFWGIREIEKIYRRPVLTEVGAHR